MKNTILFMLLFLFSCSTMSPLKNVDTTGLSYDGKSVFLNNEIIASLGAIELAYDGGELVREATFILSSAKYNEYAIKIIKCVQENTKLESNNIKFEVEVELKNE